MLTATARHQLPAWAGDRLRPRAGVHEQAPRCVPHAQQHYSSAAGRPASVRRNTAVAGIRSMPRHSQSIDSSPAACSATRVRREPSRSRQHAHALPPRRALAPSDAPSGCAASSSASCASTHSSALTCGPRDGPSEAGSCSIALAFARARARARAPRAHPPVPRRGTGSAWAGPPTRGAAWDSRRAQICPARAAAAAFARLARHAPPPSERAQRAQPPGHVRRQGGRARRRKPQHRAERLQPQRAQQALRLLRRLAQRRRLRRRVPRRAFAAQRHQLPPRALAPQQHEHAPRHPAAATAVHVHQVRQQPGACVPRSVSDTQPRLHVRRRRAAAGRPLADCRAAPARVDLLRARARGRATTGKRSAASAGGDSYIHHGGLAAARSACAAW